ncbi:hypothetical protein OBP_267 [Pseudomonas phage OBP]|jgi:hypothetical protein|uniref:hypothetical protein n=1 Tax=Pseudomonas phage OBP TaxID=1124849 RepID=UPI000240D5F4|nr:hypothetical protein OBP_267 [Pseudomonas phage OBP]AEV89704.1 hypothetical protein OBP_267 [Pseudomonas phage OBP]
MSDFSYDYSVLVVAEPDFLNKGKDIEAYMDKLNKFLTKRAGESTFRPVTVSGNYGLNLAVKIEVDDRNKTAFSKSIADHLIQFDDIVLITNFEKDPYLDVLTGLASELSKPVTIYNYEIK